MATGQSLMFWAKPGRKGVLPVVQTVLEQGGSFAGVNRKVQLKPLRWGTPSQEGGRPEILEALLILKHGGVLTHAGRQQVFNPLFSSFLLSLCFSLFIFLGSFIFTFVLLILYSSLLSPPFPRGGGG